MAETSGLDYINLHTATETDLEFLLDLRRLTFRIYAIQTWGIWDEDKQRTYLISRLDRSLIKIIQCESTAIGMLVVDEHQDEVVIEGIFLMPAHQNHGIGSLIINDVVQDAHRKGKRIRLRVLKVNPARRLYERLGFCVVQETETHYVMTCPASA